MLNKAEELLPCPFCGSKAVLEDLGDPNDDSFVHCTGRRCEVQQIARYSASDATSAWNSRASDRRRYQLEAALRITRGYILNVVEAGGHKWNHADLKTVDDALGIQEATK